MREGKNGGKLKTGGTNPGAGRPRKLPELDKLIADVLGEEKDGVTAADAILRKLRSLAAQGNLRAAEILLDRAYGKSRQPMDVTSGGKELKAGAVTIERVLITKENGAAKGGETDGQA